jgi:hypothetical protein
MVAKGESTYLFGVHDIGAEDVMAAAGRKGWVLITEGIGRDPGDPNGGNYQDLVDSDFGVMVRLNHGYGTAGTLPLSQFYDDFATRCGNFAQGSTGCHIWIIGNETNLRGERPEHGSPQEEVITPQLYARCYARCRAAIRSRPGHQNDMVLVSPVAPYNDETKYPGNERGDWVKYQQDVLGLLGPGNYDGVAIHAYTHGNTPDLITHDLKMGPPFPDRQYDFKTYQDIMAVIPIGVPVYVTEANPQSRPVGSPSGWPDGSQGTGWVQAAYKEIDAWNQAHPDRQIRSLILYRWGKDVTDQPLWTIHNRPGVVEDFRHALLNDYQWGLPPRPAYRVTYLTQQTPATFVAGETLSVQVRLRNDGTLTWLHAGANPFRLGSHWYNLANQEVPVAAGYHNDLPADVPPGGDVEVSAKVMAPDAAGDYRLRWDMVHEGVTWFTSQGDQGQIVPVRVLAEEVQIAGRGQVPKPPIEDIIAQLPAHATQRYPQRDRNQISAIILHHSAVPPSVGADRIARYQVEEQKWPGIGFHFFVLADGRLQQTQPLEVVSNQAGDVGNRTGVGVCLAGNFTDQPPPEAQLSATANLVAWLLDELDLALESIHGHSDYVNTQCPGNTWSTVWRPQLMAQVKDALAGAGPAVTAPAKTLGHYLLFWQTATDWARDDWHNAEQYVARFRVTMGFSVDDALQAEYVTIVGGPSGVPPDAEARLKAAGCKVERVAGETAAATKALLDDMAAKGQRFLTLK